MRRLFPSIIGGVLLASASSAIAVPVPVKPAACQSVPRDCGGPCVVTIRNGDPDPQQKLKDAVARDFVTVLLAPDLVLDFSGMEKEWFPISFGRCVTLTSVETLRPQDLLPTAAVGIVLGDHVPLPPRHQARSPRSLGPVLSYGPSRVSSPGIIVGDRPDTQVFLQVVCSPGGAMNDHVRISGFRLLGPSFGQQTTTEIGLLIHRCVDVHISNMEIAGWAEQGVMVRDDGGEDDEPTSNGGRIKLFDQVVVSDSFVHHNQQPTNGGLLNTGIMGHAGGYGVAVNVGAWATITRSVFDFNRHSLEASGESGGYAAIHNLQLKGGGYHGGLFNTYTHPFDVHGTGSSGHGGKAGQRFLYDSNAFQFRKDYAIKIRGKPSKEVLIARNIFPHPGLEDDWGDDAIALNTRTNVTIGSGNVINRDTYGQYGVCDFDGDAVDDLFLATGVSWWFASFGEFHWSFLAPRTEQLKDLRLGYFDADNRCDVLAQHGAEWVIFSAGTGAPVSMGSFGVPLAEVAFGRFDLRIRDHRPNVTRRTTHAFRRAANGQWYVSPLMVPQWTPVQSSSFPLNRLRFGDFTGDGVTDVLAVVGGRWSISEGANQPWRKINNFNGDEVAGLFIANLDADDNIDDLLRLDRKVRAISQFPRILRVDLAWHRSKNASDVWRPLKSYSFTYLGGWETVSPGYAFAGRFGAAPGGGILTTDPYRRGLFHSPAEALVDASTDWMSIFAY